METARPGILARSAWRGRAAGRMGGWGGVDKSAEMEQEEGRQAACLTPTGTLRVGGG